jgi:hypothetical protein
MMLNIANAKPTEVIDFGYREETPPLNTPFSNVVLQANTLTATVTMKTTLQMPCKKTCFPDIM